MCGFVGRLILNGENNHKDISRAGKLIYHRGPDEEGTYMDEKISLYFRRLSIIDLKTGHQPMSNDDGMLKIVFNGEIYNYKEIRKELLQKGCIFKTNSDTEVVLRAYEMFGKDVVNKLNGMFAFAIYDKTKHTLFLARDRMGIKPLYYFFNSEQFAFASEIKSLLMLPGITKKPNYQAIGYYLYYMYNPTDSTFFENIYKLMPGWYMVVYADGQVIKNKYWDIYYNYNYTRSEEETIYELRELIKDSVKLQLRADVPVGCHLSGGFDSSTVASIAAAYYPGKIKTFTGRFKEGQFFDESQYAKEVSKVSGTDYLEIVPTAEQFMEYIPKLIWHMDEPAMGPGLFPQAMVCRTAAEHVKVVLGGQGADEVFGGYSRYFLTIEGDSNAQPVPVWKRLQTRLMLVTSNLYRNGFADTARKVLKNVGGGPRNASERWKKYSTALDNQGLFTATLRNKIDGYDLDKGFYQYIEQASTTELFDKILYHDQKTYLPGLLQVEDRTSMAFSLESRVPLLDHRIVEYAATIPPSLKVKGWEPKYIFKQAIKGIIPEMVWQRTDKKGFPTPINAWFKGEVKPFLIQILLDQRTIKRGIFEKSKLQNLIYNSSDNSWNLWAMLNVELWFRIFIDDDQLLKNIALKKGK
ncbi:asparagine synthase (glutamine-hydrolyzing) [Desulforamulus ferrireducens]|uniref:asparagine synthase (glutamine-hydrolyzing) n=1 Tax=Desulforamulus ferrireducens TaxID=1833852 RepID=A0A1S6IZY9_9FIRM|nr:asparagine synthase (glutamine-hydrolyzing) [Desulforamulus ferrireducens]AQS60347.1 asparagine synthase (glutamine-hydrolyzing) [Desulforamulus ferrireducens]